MFQLKSMVLLFKNQGYLEAYISQKVYLEIIINESQKLHTSQATVNGKMVKWNNQLPQIKVQQINKNIKIQLRFFLNNTYIGTARTTLYKNLNRKDCLDVVYDGNGKMVIIGKFTYQAFWKQLQLNFFPEASKYMPSGIKVNKAPQTIKSAWTQPQNVQSPSIFECCFSARRKPNSPPNYPLKTLSPKVFKLPKNQSIKYSSSQLETNGTIYIEPKQIQYYSKLYYKFSDS